MITRLIPLTKRIFPTGELFHTYQQVHQSCCQELSELIMRKILTGKLIRENFHLADHIPFTGGVRSYFSVSKDLTISLKGNLLYTIDADSTTSLYNTYYLGGVDVLAGKSIPLTGFHSNEIAVDKCAGIGADFDLEVMKNVHLTLMTDFFAANEIHDNEKFSLLGGYGLEAAYMSMFGPVRIGFMHGLSSNERYYNAVKGYISIGYKF